MRRGVAEGEVGDEVGGWAVQCNAVQCSAVPGWAVGGGEVICCGS